MSDTFTIEVDDSEILLGNGRVDLSADKWCHTVCELNRAQVEIERLRGDLDQTCEKKDSIIWTLRQRIAELEKQNDERLKIWNKSITVDRAQIDAAWGRITLDSEWVLAPLGIVRCGKCKGGVLQAWDNGCPDCNGHGWVMEADNG